MKNFQNTGWNKNMGYATKVHIEAFEEIWSHRNIMNNLLD